MSLLLVVLVLIVVGVALYFFNTAFPIPMDPRFKSAINWIVIIVVVIWLLNIFGILALLGIVKIPTLK